MGVAFEYRTREYRAGVMVVVVCCGLTLAGFCTGHWVDRGQTHYGLWTQCTFQPPPLSMLLCGPPDGSLAPESMLQVPRILISLELVYLAISFVIIIVVNCRHYVPIPRHRYLEIFVCMAGLFGLVGTAVFWSDKRQLDRDSQTVTALSWSFYLVLLDSVALLLAACLIACNDDVIPGSDDVSLTACVRDFD